MFDTSMTTASSASTPRMWKSTVSVAEAKPERFIWRAALGWVPVSGLSLRIRYPLTGVPTVTLPLLTPAPAVSLSTHAALQLRVPSLFEKLALVNVSLKVPDDVQDAGGL